MTARTKRTVADHGASPAKAHAPTMRDAARELLSLGQRLRILRESCGYTQEEAGARSGVHAKHLGVIENGKVNVTFVSLVALARAYGVTVGELFA